MKKQDRTKHAIIDAAEKVFLRKGYDAARTMEIAELAGVTHGMLHYYYRTKEQLFELVLLRKVEQMRAILLKLDIDSEHANQNFIDRLCAMVSKHFDFMTENKDLPTLFLNIVNDDSPYLDFVGKNIRTVKNELFANLEKETNAAIAKGEICDIDVRALVVDILTFDIFSIVLYSKMTLLGINLYPTYDEYCAARKQEILTTLRKRLMPT